MIEIKSDEGLMLWIIHRLNELYPEKAILKGGMVLKLLNCPRYTNDLDYIFVPFRSKKEILPLIAKVLNELEEAQWSYNMHSTSLRIKVAYQGCQTQIEANVDKECKSKALSTDSLATGNNQAPHIIRVMSYDVMMAHKMAAWNERRLIRDLYDIDYIFTYLNVLPDIKTLKERLMKVVYRDKRLKKEATKMSIIDYLEKLKTHVATLEQKEIDAELSDSLSKEERAGLHMNIRAGINRLITKMDVNKTGKASVKSEK